MIMVEPKVAHSTFTVERHYAQAPSAVFAALTDPDKLRRWYADREQDILEFTADAREGGQQRLVYRFKEGSPVAGKTIVNDGRYLSVVPEERVVLSMTMDLDQTRVTVSQVTLELLPAEGGTDLVCTYQGAYLDGAMPEPAKMFEAGWKSLLDKLGKVLEG